MNKIIKEQLDKCKIKLPEYNDSTTHLIIEKQLSNKEIIQESVKEAERDHYYIIQLQYYIINPPDNFTLSSNWNNGINPTSEYLLGTPIKFVGKMIQWDCCGYDYKNKNPLDDVYNGLWLPSKGFTIVEEVK